MIDRIGRGARAEGLMDMYEAKRVQTDCEAMLCYAVQEARQSLLWWPL